jgi:segregation and condensation protein B
LDYSTSNDSAKDNEEQTNEMDSSAAQPDVAHLDAGQSPHILSLEAAVEALLFVADSPVSVGRLAEALQVTPGQVERALEDLEATYAERGLRLQRAGSRVQLITAPQVAPAIERFLGLEARAYLSRAALETLSIIVYRQPITRPEIETIRGVGSDSVLRTLLRYGLIDEVGRAPTVGHPILYGTTFEFLQHFGLRSLEEMPPLEEMPTSGETSGADAHQA